MNILVVGGAKTGTTVISRTIHSSVADAKFHMEPKLIDVFVEPSASEHSSNVVKVIFEHWNKSPNLRQAMIAGELPMSFDKVVLISRDPRDEALSRLMYFIYPWLTRNGMKGNEGKVNQWLDFIRLVEDNPEEHSFLQMVDKIKEIFSTRLMVGNLKGFRPFREFCIKRKQAGNGFVLKYEDFISHERGELEAYLGFNLVDESGLSSQDRTRRSATYNNWKMLFKQEDLAFFKTYLGDLMSEQGYDDWELPPCPATLPKKDYSSYVKRLVAERRSFERKAMLKNLFN